MVAANPSSIVIRELNSVGRYAVGVMWGDGHDSIYTLDSLRRFCPCEACSSAPPDRPVAEAELRLHGLARLGEQSLFIEWADRHQTLYKTAALRSLCRCARCVAEPERPVTGS